MNRYDNRLRVLMEEYETLISRENEKILPGNGIFERYKYPILTAAHTPLEWRYDFNPETNPYFMERFGINAVFNAGAIKFNEKYLVMGRVEGYDANHSLPLPKALTVLIVSTSGSIRFNSRIYIPKKRMYMICA